MMFHLYVNESISIDSSTQQRYTHKENRWFTTECYKKGKISTNNFTCIDKIKMKIIKYICVKPNLIIRHVLENVNTNMINSKRVSLLMLDLRMLNYIGNYFKSVRVLIKSNISLSVYEQYFKSVNNRDDSFFYSR